ncbi:N-acetylglucosamine-6-phosphate deacetylase [Luteolibacter sp. LG18]|uniref:N-acetylglucosamine-6-phosphate deacetylase n=1 Tax=Luteolibacter sp. LG18 TaxID=2819286 RepID=UPI002B2F09F9|nr:N-acetylglucosamine-6-phosphate deacetylase [Luteolibacter sp. LG18]
MKRTLIQNARIVSPDRDLENGALLLEDGRIAAVYEAGAELPAADTVIDAAGRIAMPGFFDIHCHGADGHDVCDNSLEAIRHIARKKLQEGVTTWLPTTLTQPQDKLEEIAGKIAEYMANPEFTRAPGVHVEGPFINKEKAGAQNPEYVRLPNFPELKAFHDIAPALIVSLAPEMPGALEVIREAKAHGITSSAAHTSSTAAHIAAAKDAGLTHLTHFGNAMTPLHHREIGVVGTGLMDDSIKIELICDTVHLAPDMLKLIFKLVPIDRILMITDSMAASWIGNGECMLGGLEVVVENDVARLKHGGALAGSALLYNDGVKNVAAITGLPLSQIVKTTSWNQAQSLGLEGFGKLEPGFHADIVLLDSDFNVWKTLVGGEER